MFKKVSFEELIDKINSLDYVNLPEVTCFSFKFRTIKNKEVKEYWGMIDDDENVLITRADKLNEPELIMEPDCMELYDTIRKVSLFLDCTDDMVYEIDIP